MMAESFSRFVSTCALLTWRFVYGVLHQGDASSRATRHLQVCKTKTDKTDMCLMVRPVLAFEPNDLRRRLSSFPSVPADHPGGDTTVLGHSCCCPSTSHLTNIPAAANLCTTSVYLVYSVSTPS